MRGCLLFLFVFTLYISCQGNPGQDTSQKHPRRFLLLPIAVDAPETNFGFGAVSSVFFKTKEDTLVRTSNIEAYGLYTLHNQIIIQNGGNIYFPKENYILRWNAYYAYYPNRFWGIGNNTPDGNRQLYTYKEIMFTPQLLRRVHRRWFLGIYYEYQNTIDLKFNPGGILDDSSLTGRLGGISSGIGPVVAWDSRNNAFSPNKGEYFRFALTHFGKYIGSQFNFTTYSIDFRKYIRSFRRNVFAFQAYGQFTSGSVPLRELPLLGGPYMLRGYYLGRLIDKNAAILQAEYRMPVWWRFGVVGFAGIGKVSSTIKNLGLNDVRYAIGTGIRFAVIPKEKLNIRFDFAVGKHTSAFYINIMEAF